MLHSNRKTRGFLAVGAGSLVACLLASAASAGAPIRPVTVEPVRFGTDDVPAVRVRYADLDLRTDQGVRELYRRIERAARQVCPAADSRDLTQLALARRCEAGAVSRAIEAVHSSKLAVLHASQARGG